MFMNQSQESHDAVQVLTTFSSTPVCWASFIYTSKVIGTAYPRSVAFYDSTFSSGDG